MDKIFSSNVLHQEPLALLKFIWPYIDEIRSEAVVPELNGQMLRQQILRRKPNTAAGIDGWRTVETQCLSLFVLEQIAAFFKRIEDGSRQMPKQLATAKQVLLNKNGMDDPMQKRIISLLRIFLLAFIFYPHQISLLQAVVFKHSNNLCKWRCSGLLFFDIGYQGLYECVGPVAQENPSYPFCGIYR